jgi:hypothetical protein
MSMDLSVAHEQAITEQRSLGMGPLIVGVS